MSTVSAEYLGLCLALLVIVPQVAVYGLHVAVLMKGRRARPFSARYESRAENVSFILPVRKEPLDYLENAIRYVGSLGIPGYEVIVVSDDDAEDKNALFKLIEKLREEGLNVWLLWRSNPRGYRTGALNDGLYLAVGDYIYILDVDSRPEKCFFDYAVAMLNEHPDYIGVVGRWEPLNTDTRVSEALALGMRFLTRVLYRYRSYAGLFTFPLGTGTLYKAKLLKGLLGGWDEKRIQDDMEIGARIMHHGLKVAYLDKCAIRVENPGTYKSYRIQQSRWSYGALDAAISRFKSIAKSKYPVHVRIEALLYLLQYMPQTLMFIGTLLLALLTPFTSVDYMVMALPLILLWVITLVAYTYCMYREGYWGTSLWNFAVLSGRLSALSMAVSPYVAASSVKALLRLSETYKRTPKGTYQKMYLSLRVPWELLFGTLFGVLGTYALIRGLFFTAAWLLLCSAGFLYTVYRFPRDVFYK